VLSLSLLVAGIAVPDGAAHDSRFDTDLSGYEEVPTLSTTGTGKFRARLRSEGTAIGYSLSYAELESAVTQAHIHFGATALNGPIVVFLCSNLGNGPAGTQECPPAPATITGTFDAGDVLAGAAAQGLEAGNFAELVAAIRAGATYVNVHSVERPGGEIRGQLDGHGRHDD
jgi:hypothetical protein